MGYLRTFLGVTMALCWLAAPAFAQGTQRRCWIKTIVGEVKIRRGKQVQWRRARPRMPVRQNDAIRTFVESEAVIETSEGTRIEIGESSTMEMAAFTSPGKGSGQTRVKILSGNVLSDVKKLVGTKSKFEFETPTAVASIRGTRVGFNVSSEQTRIEVYEGRVMVVPRGARNGAELKANQMTTVKRGEKSVTVQALESPKEDSTIAVDTTGTDSTQAAADSARADTTAEQEADTTAPADTSASADTGQAATQIELAVRAPAEGAVFEPGAQIPVRGRVGPPGTELLVRGKSVKVAANGDFRAMLPGPDKEGEYTLEVQARRGGQAKEQIISFAVGSVDPSSMALSLATPREGQTFSEPLIPVQGTAAPGSRITVAGLNIDVPPSGTFSGQIPIPAEETAFELEFEVTLGGQSKTVTRTIYYKPELTLTVTAPGEQQVVGTRTVQIQGEVKPRGAEVYAMGNKLSVRAGGTFSGVVMIPDEEGEVQLELEAVFGDASKTETRTIVYKRAVDTYRPVVQPGALPNVSRQDRLLFTVIDRTPDDEITFYRETDGVRDSETGDAGGRFTLELEEGIHRYELYAEDRAGNRSNRVAGTVSYLPSVGWSLRMRKPMGNDVIHLPPNAPDSDFDPQYTVEFSVENLPDDDPELLKEVVVTNTTTGQVEADRNISDVDFEFDMEITRGKPNVFTVRVRDVNDVDRTAKFTVVVR